MRYARLFAAALAVSSIAPALACAQEETSRAVANGGIHVAGWRGTVDPKEVTAGQVLTNARLAAEGSGFKVTTGPAITYWNPANVAKGDYTVKATFHEAQYMALNNHPHPYGIVIGGNDMGTEKESYLYCAAYGNGRFIVRGFGPAAFQLNGRGTEHPAVNKAAGPGQPVTQEIAVSVRGDRVSCTINGTEVASFPRADVVGAGKLTSTDGVYGFRFAHNTEAAVTGFTMTPAVAVKK